MLHNLYNPRKMERVEFQHESYARMLEIWVRLNICIISFCQAKPDLQGWVFEN